MLYRQLIAMLFMTSCLCESLREIFLCQMQLILCKLIITFTVKGISRND